MKYAHPVRRERSGGASREEDMVEEKKYLSWCEKMADFFGFYRGIAVTSCTKINLRAVVIMPLARYRALQC
jgi:hypothetical protein